jgi:hypothetical protein
VGDAGVGGRRVRLGPRAGQHQGPAEAHARLFS